MKLRNVAIKYGRKFGKTVAAGSAFMAGHAMAAVDTAAVQASLTAAQTSGETVGGWVIGLVAGLIVVGIIITMVKKA